MSKLTIREWGICITVGVILTILLNIVKHWFFQLIILIAMFLMVTLSVKHNKEEVKIK